MNKRKDYPDSVIMNALDACNYSIPKAAERLGVRPNTLYHWIQTSDNLRQYRNMKLEMDAVTAREKLNDMLAKLDALDPRVSGHVISICKILIDKAEANKMDNSPMKVQHEIDKDLEDKIRKLLGE